MGCVQFLDCPLSVYTSIPPKLTPSTVCMAPSFEYQYTSQSMTFTNVHMYTCIYCHTSLPLTDVLVA